VGKIAFLTTNLDWELFVVYKFVVYSRSMNDIHIFTLIKANSREERDFLAA